MDTDGICWTLSVISVISVVKSFNLPERMGCDGDRLVAPRRTSSCCFYRTFSHVWWTTEFTVAGAYGGKMGVFGWKNRPHKHFSPEIHEFALV